jgi:hypothetical protein
MAAERNVAFTDFMLRVASAMEGREPAPALRLVPSAPRSRARAVDDWFMLRTRTEQVMAEANAMLNHQAAIFDLEDEFGTGRLAFTISRGELWIRMYLVTMDEVRQGWVVLERSASPSPGRLVEPRDPGVLEDLLIGMLQEA